MLTAGLRRGTVRKPSMKNRSALAHQMVKEQEFLTVTVRALTQTAKAMNANRE